MLQGTAMWGPGPQISGSNAMMSSPWSTPSQGAQPAAAPANPYLAGYAQDVNAMYPAAQAANQASNALSTQMQMYGGGSNGQAAASAGSSTSPSTATSSYPSFPNSFGLGDSSSFTQVQPNMTVDPSQNSAPGYGAQPPNSASIDSTTQGFSPWSMSGEANSRK